MARKQLLLHLIVLTSMLLALPVTVQAQPVVPGGINAPTEAETNFALRMDGVNDYVTFGSAASLGASAFTLEVWFNWTGGGATTSTGSGGLSAVIPLISKGRGEADGDNRDMNYLLGIQGGKLAADFEEGAGGATPGLNHPVTGEQTISPNTWHHAAATYDGRVWRLYLDGNLDKTLDLGSSIPPRSDSIQHAGLGTAMTSSGAAAGYFAGVMDEARIWNYARSGAEIQAAINQEITAPTSGLLGRWGMNDGSGTTAINTIAGSPAGTLTNGPVWVCGKFALNCGVRLNGSSQYATFGSAASLGASAFTLEVWFNWTGGGVTTSTGSGGLSAVIPLISKGRGEADGDNRDMNYLLGIQGGKLAADFEEGIGGATPGLNHPVTGEQTISPNMWHHAAVTYDGRVWRLYLDGNLDKTLDLGSSIPPRSDSIQHAGLGTAMTSSGAAAGYFAGVMDEARIWNYARSGAEIQATINQEITAPTSGLLGRWGMNENQGSTIGDSSGAGNTGTLVGTPDWYTGAPFNISFTPPLDPSGLIANAGLFQVDLTWSDNSSNEASFEVERSNSGAGGPFTLLVTVAANSVAYTDNSALPSTEYCYRVRAVNSGGPSGYTNVACATTSAEGSYALDLNHSASNTYVSFGNAANLNLAQFTLETWFRRDGTGTPYQTGTSGIANAIPLISNGAPEADGSAVDINYVLCIDNDMSVLCADFEEGAGGTTPGLNHPINGQTPIMIGEWYHAAVTYDGSRWQLFLNGNLEAEQYVGQPTRSDNSSPSALGTMLTSAGTVRGLFNGALDEVRIWNYARSQSDILATINSELTEPQTGLVARWGMNEGAGTVVHDSISPLEHGAISGSTTYAWEMPGAPFNITIAPPAAPSFLRAAPQSIDQIYLTWKDNANSETGFYLERCQGGGCTDFTLVGQVGANIASYTDSGLSAATTYCYRVYAQNTGGSSGYSNTVCKATLSSPAYALDFGSGSAYASFGNAADLSQFTLETWLRRDGTGVATTTGSGGETLIPLITNGTAEVETAAADVNYFFGIRGSDGVLCADFEEAQNGASPSLNHPVCGTTRLQIHTWYHAAATYDGVTWRLYLNGNLERELAVNQPVNTANQSPLAFGTAIESNGTTTEGYFDGVLDEVRIWNVARTQDEIKSTINQQINTAQANLVGRWALEEGSGSAVNSSAGTTINGVISGSGYSWVPGAPFNIINLAPFQPVSPSPADGATDGTFPSQILRVTVGDPNQDALTVRFYGRKQQVNGGDFTIAVLPDTQYYSKLYPATFSAQTGWIVANQAARNIVFVTHLGDIVESGDAATAEVDTEWNNARDAIYLLETAPANIPYGLGIGNHDQATSGNPDSATNHYNLHFGESHFQGRPYYGGHYGSNNDNHYEIFTAAGMEFIIVHLEASESSTNATFQGAVAWADNLLVANSGKRAIVVFHNLFSLSDKTQFSSSGAYLFDQLKDNPNLFLLLGGHVPGVSQRADAGTDGHTIYSLLADYQSEPNGGNGYLRLLTFKPQFNQINVTTYSPTLNQYKTDSGNQFSLSYNMSATGFGLIGTADVPAGTPDFHLPSAPLQSDAEPSVIWSDLEAGVTYEWYVTVDDGQNIVTGPTWTFTPNQPTAVTLSSFEAASDLGVVRLVWQTASEIDLVGFNLYRSTTVDGNRQLLNPAIIPGQAVGGVGGAEYVFTVPSEPGVVYYYWLEAVMIGTSELYGPIPVAGSFLNYLPMMMR